MACASKFRPKFGIVAFSCVIYLRMFKIECLLPQGDDLQILATWNVMKCFSTHSGIHDFAPIWHIISIICAIWVHNHVCQNVQKNISWRSKFLEFAINGHRATQMQIYTFAIYYTEKYKENAIISNFNRNFNARAMNYFFSRLECECASLCMLRIFIAFLNMPNL